MQVFLRRFRNDMGPIGANTDEARWCQQTSLGGGRASVQESSWTGKGEIHCPCLGRCHRCRSRRGGGCFDPAVCLTKASNRGGTGEGRALPVRASRFLGKLRSEGLPGDLRAPVGPVWNSRRHSPAGARLELEVEVGQPLSHGRVFPSELQELSVRPQSCHPCFVGSCLMEEDLVLVRDSGPGHLSAHVFRSLLVDSALLTQRAQAPEHLGAFLLEGEATSLLLNGSSEEQLEVLFM